MILYELIHVVDDDRVVLRSFIREVPRNCYLVFDPSAEWAVQRVEVRQLTQIPAGAIEITPDRENERG